MAYKDTFQCFSFACSDLDTTLTESLKYTNKVLLPPEILNKVVNENKDSDIEFPLFFFIENPVTTYKCICSVHEFTAPAGVCNIPYCMLEDLCINEGDTINIELVLPVTGSFIKIRPHETAFIDLPDPKAVLELCFSTDYQVLANSSTITVFDKQSEKSYLVDIVETQPSDYIKMIDTDIEVDFDKPLDYIEPIPSPEPSPPPSPVNTFNQSTGFVPFSGKGYKLGSK